MLQTNWSAGYIGAGECRRVQVAASEFLFGDPANRLVCREHLRSGTFAREDSLAEYIGAADSRRAQVAATEF